MNGMRTALFVSLAANLLLVGLIAGALLGDMRHGKGGGDAVRAPNLERVLAAIPPERAASVRAQVVQVWRNGRAEREEARAARMEVARLVASDTYDSAATRQAFARMRAADAAVAALFQDTLSQSMASMTVEERRTMLRALSRGRLAQAAAREARRETRAEP